MMMLALLMVPWSKLMRNMQLQPRLLADDVLLMAAGPGAWERFQQGFNATHVYIMDLGGKIAAAKSYLFSTDRAWRNRLRAHHWEHLDCLIRVVLHVRDLGAHEVTLHGY